MYRRAAGDSLVRGAELLVRAAPGTSIALGAIMLIRATTSPLLIVMSGMVVGALSELVRDEPSVGAQRHLLVVLAGFAATAIAGVVLSSIQSYVTSSLRLRVAAAVDERIAAAAVDPQGISHLDDPAFADSMRLATGDETRPDLIVRWLPSVLVPRLQALVLVLVLAQLAWWAPLLLAIAAVITYRQYRRIAESAHGSTEMAAAVLRRTNYFRGLAVDPEPAKEVRVFGLAEWVVARMTDAWRTGMATIWSGRRAAYRQAYLAIPVLLLAEGAVLLYAMRVAAEGRIGLAALVMFAQAALALPVLGWAGDGDLLVRNGLVGLRAVAELERRGRDRPAALRIAPTGPAARPVGTIDPSTMDIVFEGVSFAYPRGEGRVLDGLDLRIPAGASVAIVGVNGAGKTTLIKLLARLYDPDDGRICVGGADLRQYAPAAWRDRVAVVLQDFVKYPLPLSDNVGFGDLRAAHHPDALVRALDQAGAGSLPGQLPDGWDSVLSRRFARGTDLSGGQWQKVALARALLAVRGGGLLILDEPTANLDARAELALFEHIIKTARETTTVLVSHRFSSVRHADLIYVLEGGRVVEAGSHTELIGRDGRYAQMFRLQASRLDRDLEEAATTAGTGADQRSSRAPSPAAVTGVADRTEVTGPRERRSLRGSLAAMATLAKGCFRESPRLGLRAAVLVPAAAALGALQAFWLRTLIDGTHQGSLASATAGALLLILTLGAGNAIDLAGTAARITLSERVGFAFDRMIATLTASIPGLQHHESPVFQDRLHVLRANMLGMGGLLNWWLNLFQDLAGFLVTAVLLATVHPALLALPAVGLVALRLQAGARKVMARAEEAAAPDYRRAAELLRLAGSPAAGQEIRIFGLDGEIRGRIRSARTRADAVMRRGYGRMAVFATASGLLAGLAMVAAVVVVATLAANGDAGFGAVVLAFMLANRFIEHLTGLVQATGVVVQLVQTAERFRWLHAYARYVAPAATAAATATAAPAAARTPQVPAGTGVPSTLRHGVVLEQVSFRYPGTARWILRDVSLHLPAGCVVALVGENGSGKTTLVKLLSRCYEPTTGRILVDGTDLAALPPAGWRRAISAGFQDFMRFELLAKEAVGVGDLPRVTDRPAVRQALTRAGAADLGDALPAGLETQLGARWRGGIEPSGGQWQQLALGRALMRPKPLLLVLDEPTASLDAEAEHALFERFSALARGADQDGTIMLLVSHRFSTVRMADLIVVLDAGGVVEVGGHEQLMAGGGLYRELYGLQARAYR